MTEYIDLGATTDEAKRISRKSRELARKLVGDKSRSDRLKQRVVIATGDPVFASLLRIDKKAIDASIKAVDKGRDIVVDISMVESGVLRKKHGCRVVKALGKGDSLAKEKGFTRTAAGFIVLKEQLEGSVAVIGNAPSAALALCKSVLEEEIKPSLIVATPVGFVNAEKSKNLIHRLDIPSITCRGTRGGSAVAVAAVNELITMAVEEKN